jgi:hypothetical protein
VPAVAAVAAIAAGLGIGVPALDGAHVAVDEEQYVLSALSLAEDGDLDIADELHDQRWRAFADVVPEIETSVLPGGRQISPHDPLLPLLLALPARLGGWVGMKIALAGLAGVLAGLLLWLATVRFGVSRRTAVPGVAVAGASMPLAVYGQQLYPELPAALVVLLGVLALTGAGPAREPAVPAVDGRGSGPRRGELVLLAAAVTALPWLSVKYSLVALALAVLGAVRWWRAGRRAEVGVLAVTLTVLGIGYLAVHRVVWGGWTAYASGDHFAQTGEFAVVGVDPDYAERALRIAGLLLDREFGLVPWQPAWLLLVPAVAALLCARPGAPPAAGAGGCPPPTTARGTGTAAVPRDAVAQAAGPLGAPREDVHPPAVWPHRGVLLWLLGAGWFVATFVAFTMHGYWFPGRQVVVVAPLAVLVILLWLDRASAAAQRVALALGAAGVLGYAVFLVDGYRRTATWAVHFVDSHHPVRRLLAPVLTHWRYDYRWPHLAAVGVLAVLAWWGVRAQRPRSAATPDLDRTEPARSR